MHNHDALTKKHTACSLALSSTGKENQLERQLQHDRMRDEKRQIQKLAIGCPHAMWATWQQYAPQAVIGWSLIS